MLKMWIGLVYNAPSGSTSRTRAAGSPRLIGQAVVYYAIGVASAVAALGLAGLAGATLALLAVYGRSGRVVWPRAGVLGGRLLHAPLAFLVRAVGGRPGLLDLFVIESANAAMARRFARAGPVRMLAVPQCLRSGECAARLHPDDGYRCQGCGKCPLAALDRAAAERGFRLFIVPGGGMARRLVRRLGVDAALGVACPSELRRALLAVRSMGVPAVGVPLASGGCFETRVDLGRVREAMERCGSASSVCHGRLARPCPVASGGPCVQDTAGQASRGTR
ncbi:MAG: DUF116 domain-containing protein [Planctomycetes bacterium]|nr:DUF116 domain-containing protein [Planctomycetota bacterium]